MGKPEVHDGGVYREDAGGWETMEHGLAAKILHATSVAPCR
jgi:hypothetical protein